MNVIIAVIPIWWTFTNIYAIKLFGISPYVNDFQILKELTYEREFILYIYL